jgi:hypothetical protein
MGRKYHIMMRNAATMQLNVQIIRIKNRNSYHEDKDADLFKIEKVLIRYLPAKLWH